VKVQFARFGFALLIASAADSAPIVGLTTGNALITFDSNSPGAVSPATGISGLEAGENLLAIDFRPSSGVLYGLGSTSRIYTIDVSTGQATAVSSTPFSTLLEGTSFGFDFNPVVDAIRIVSNADQNLRVNPDTGALISVDTPLAFTSTLLPNVVGSAYSNSFAGATSTILYGYDAVLSSFFIQSPPNAGTLIPGAGIDISVTPSALIGFDISGSDTVFFSTWSLLGTRLYTADILDGTGQFLGTVGPLNNAGEGIIQLQGIAASPVPEPGTFILLTSAGVALLAVRRRRVSYGVTKVEVSD
jgi:hypothetical protein